MFDEERHTVDGGMRAGVWINLGPLLFHWADAHTYLSDGELSIELSLETVERLAAHYHLRTVRREFRQCKYTTNNRSMLQVCFCVCVCEGESESRTTKKRRSGGGGRAESRQQKWAIYIQPTVKRDSTLRPAQRRLAHHHHARLPPGVAERWAGVSTRPAGFPHPWGATSCREAAPLTYLEREGERASRRWSRWWLSESGQARWERLWSHHRRWCVLGLRGTQSTYTCAFWTMVKDSTMKDSTKAAAARAAPAEA